MRRLPIDDVLPDVVAALRRGPNCVLQAPTGAGKTTRVPPAVWDAGLTGGKQVVLLEPRRVAARAAARRMAAERGGRLGGEVGYQVRFDRQAGRDTRILAVTPGILLQMMQADPLLESVGAIVFDEFHERGVEADLALGVARYVQSEVRDDLRLAVMSATLDAGAAAAYLHDCPVVTSEGRLFPIDIEYRPRPAKTPWPAAAAAAVASVLSRTPGDVLVFLPGLGEIRATASMLDGGDALVLPLHGELPPAEQDRALAKHDRRKVVLATNVAEASVTVEGVTCVVDTGLARVSGYDAAVGMDRLELQPVPRASADQRAGRAGRLQPGLCVRLWAEEADRTRPAQLEPEVRRVDAAGPLLRLMAMGEADPRSFAWMEPPPAEHLDRAESLLRLLGLTGDGGITELGRRVAALPVQPRVGRLLVEADEADEPARLAAAAALLSERDPFPRDRPPAATDSDLLERVEALEDYERTGRPGRLNEASARFVLRARDQFLRLVRPAGGDVPWLRALVAGFPDRLAKRREPGGRVGVMVGNRGVRLGPSSGVVAGDYFLCLDVDAGDRESLVRLASGVEEDWLTTETTTEVVFDAEGEQVVARHRVRCGGLLLRESPAALPDDDRVTRALVEAAARRPGKVLPGAESAAGRLLLRLACLREWMPERELPDLGEAELLEVLGWLAPDCRSFEGLRRADWVGALRGRLTPDQWRLLEAEAPEKIDTPAGPRALAYEPGRPPVLAVKIQDLFGVRETPRVAGGRVVPLLHLLAPNRRVQQITDDLASFWANTYPQVRKDLRGRYPKHAWPEDPLAAQPRPSRK